MQPDLTQLDGDDLTLADLDRDGALREACARLPSAEEAGRDSRRGFLGKTLLAGGAALATLARPTTSQAQSKGDTAILNYALVLEYLQADFYTEAERRKALRGESRKAARVIGAVERAHVQALRDVLGKKAVKEPFFDFRGTTEEGDAFLRTAVAFEDLATAAYKGQAPLVQSPQVLAAALSIHTVEARHAAWIRYLVGASPSPNAFDEPKPKAQVLELVASTRFIVRRPLMEASGNPRYTG
jgi:rubrerythrin